MCIPILRAAESESEPESESVGVGCLSRSRSWSRSRQNLPTLTDSGQALIRDSQKSPCRLFRPFLRIFLWLTGWTINSEPSPALFCIVEMAIGRNFGPRPNLVPISVMCQGHRHSVPVITRVQISFSFDQAQSQKGFRYDGGSNHSTRSGPGRVQVGSSRWGPVCSFTWPTIKCLA